MFYNTNKLFREAGAEGGGGLPAGYKTMSEIEEEAKKNPSGIEPGDGTKKVPVLDINDPNYKKPDTEVIPEGKIKAADGTFIDDPNYKKVESVVPEIPAGKKLDVDGKTFIDDPDYVEPEPPNFWEEVEKHTGKPVKVEYPEGVEPDTVEGAAIREQAVREAAIDEWEENLKRDDPRGFAYLLHRANGGNDESFLGGDKGITLPTREAVEASVDIQTNLFKNDLLNKGVEPEVVEAALASAIKKNELKDKSLKLYDGIQTAQTKQLADATERNRQETLRIDGIIKQTTTKIEKVIPELSFVVPEADKKAFQAFIEDNTQYNKHENKFYIIQPLDIDNPKGQLESLFFQFKKGDLSKIIQQKVATQAAQKLRLQADKSKKPTPTGGSDGKDQKQFVPLGSMGIRTQ